MPQLVLGVRTPLVRRKAVPLHRLTVILQNALAHVVHQPDIELGDSQTLFGERPI